MADELMLPASPVGADMDIPATVPLTLMINGTSQALRLEPRVSLLDAWREYLAITGPRRVATKARVAHARCWSTVHACLTLAVQCEGRAITMFEGLADGGDTLHPLQTAFVEHDGFQCDCCTPGQEDDDRE